MYSNVMQDLRSIRAFNEETEKMRNEITELRTKYSSPPLLPLLLSPPLLLSSFINITPVQRYSSRASVRCANRNWTYRRCTSSATTPSTSDALARTNASVPSAPPATAGSSRSSALWLVCVRSKEERGERRRGRRG